MKKKINNNIEEINNNIIEENKDSFVEKSRAIPPLFKELNKIIKQQLNFKFLRAWYNENKQSLEFMNSTQKWHKLPKEQFDDMIKKYNNHTDKQSDLTFTQAVESLQKYSFNVFNYGHKNEHQK